MRNADVARRFAAGQPARAGNARTDGRTYWLFGHPIAVRRQDGSIQASWCGHRTATTRNHLNMILDAYGSGRMRISIAAGSQDTEPDEFTLVPARP